MGRSNRVAVDRRDEFVHLAVERFHLLGELAHHLASDLINLYTKLNYFVIDLLVDLVELVHEVIGVALGLGSVSVRMQVRWLVVLGLHLVDVLVRRVLPWLPTQTSSSRVS